MQHGHGYAWNGACCDESLKFEFLSCITVDQGGLTLNNPGACEGRFIALFHVSKECRLLLSVCHHPIAKRAFTGQHSVLDVCVGSHNRYDAQQRGLVVRSDCRVASS
jgi:hypothetical protein